MVRRTPALYQARPGTRLRRPGADAQGWHLARLDRQGYRGSFRIHPSNGEAQADAWLFRDPPLAKVLGYEFGYGISLVDWLPPEDWTPVINAVAAREWLVGSLAREAERKNRWALACRLQTATGRACKSKPAGD
ncbi:hypothetical protein [Tahibacter amnicola]|uniref:Uncharacterized protein n=1 Tax=Tahibacter amnicola TaxID=2976241 RepID=A0ABY6BI87_9GAMM|nr:hypothetical protein [Tahibacter amnicola]UXI68080.1 hypothetical protein N4264_00045 [Tahibacter amnicola]